MPKTYEPNYSVEYTDSTSSTSSVNKTDTSKTPIDVRIAVNDIYYEPIPETWVGDAPPIYDPYNPYKKYIPNPVYPIDTEAIKIYRKIVGEDNLGIKGEIDNRPPHLIAIKDKKYFIKVELPGVDLSRLKVERQGYKITLLVSDNPDLEFNEEEIKFDNTALDEYCGEYIWEIPSDVDPVPRALFFKNGILTMAFSVISITESIEIEGESERDFLAEALEKLTSQE